MTEQELRKLNRAELLEILIELSRENKALKEKLADQTLRLEERAIKIDKLGSIAEASLALNGVFESAQSACEQYIANVKRLSDEQSRNICEERLKESQEEADRLLRETEQKCLAMKEAARKKSTRILIKSFWQSALADDTKKVVPVDTKHRL